MRRKDDRPGLLAPRHGLKPGDPAKPRPLLILGVVALLAIIAIAALVSCYPVTVRG